jgi:hypothetical protein
MQCGCAVGFGGVDIDLLLEKGGNCGAVVVLNGGDEAKVRSVGRQSKEAEQDAGQYKPFG